MADFYGHYSLRDLQVENRNKLLACAVTSAALLPTSLGSNDYIVEQLSGEVVRWSSQCLNNSAITSYQNENNITAYEEHEGVPSPFVTETVFP